MYPKISEMFFLDKELFYKKLNQNLDFIIVSHSFMISPAKNIFKCFGCGKEGGPVEFIMAIQNKNFDEAAVIAAMSIDL